MDKYDPIPIAIKIKKNAIENFSASRTGSGLFKIEKRKKKRLVLVKN